jgi:Fe-S cluster biosynthesis and repair protein YggX
MTKTITCIKLGSDQEAMDFPPFPGALGERIFQNVSKSAWKAWLEQQKMLVNENRLNLADPEARKYLKEQTESYFFGDGADSAQGFVPVD